MTLLLRDAAAVVGWQGSSWRADVRVEIVLAGVGGQGEEMVCDDAKGLLWLLFSLSWMALSEG